MTMIVAILKPNVLERPQSQEFNVDLTQQSYCMFIKTFNNKSSVLGMPRKITKSMLVTHSRVIAFSRRPLMTNGMF